MSLTAYDPVIVYTFEGCCSTEVFPLPKSQNQDAAFWEVFVNETLIGGHPRVSETENDAMGDCAKDCTMTDNRIITHSITLFISVRSCFHEQNY